MGHLLFKLSVDQNLMGNILAAGIDIDPDQRPVRQRGEGNQRRDQF